MPARTAKTGITVDSIKATELYGVLGHAAGESLPLGDPAILQKLFAAEDFYERDLQLSWRPTRAVSAPETRANAPDVSLRVTDFDSVLDLGEPAYDYPRELWQAERSGLIRLRHRPIRTVQQVVFVWPGLGTAMRIPPEWVQMDARAGTINLIPTMIGLGSGVSFNALMLSRFLGGRGLPHSILIDYVTGFSADELQWKHQDLLQGVRLRTLLMLGGIISTIASGGRMSAALSMDGLSHSRGFGGKFGAYSGAIQLALQEEQAIRETWRAAEQPVPISIVV